MWGSELLGNYAKRAFSGSLWGAAAGMTAWQGAGNLLGKTGRAASIGAAAGGAYGAFSDNTSILGGMAAGAGLGVGSRVGARYGGAALGGARFRGNLWTSGRLGGESLYGAMGLGAGKAMKATAIRDSQGIFSKASSMISNNPIVAKMSFRGSSLSSNGPIR